MLHRQGLYSKALQTAAYIPMFCVNCQSFYLWCLCRFIFLAFAYKCNSFASDTRPRVYYIAIQPIFKIFDYWPIGSNKCIDTLLPWHLTLYFFFLCVSLFRVFILSSGLFTAIIFILFGFDIGKIVDDCVVWRFVFPYVLTVAWPICILVFNHSSYVNG